jgi:hypothetical protein
MRRILSRTAITAAAAAILLVASASPALAQADLPTVISNATAWIVGILVGLATLFLTVGGALYLMAGGDPGQIEKAKTALKSALLGYALAVLAPVLLAIVRGILGAG